MDSHLAASGLHFPAPSHICQWSLNAFIQQNFMECLTNHWCTNSKDWPTLRNNSVLNSGISSFLRQLRWEKRHTSKWFTVLTEEVLGEGGDNPLPLFCKQRPETSLRAQKWRQRRPWESFCVSSPESKMSINILTIIKSSEIIWVDFQSLIFSQVKSDFF